MKPKISIYKNEQGPFIKFGISVNDEEMENVSQATKILTVINPRLSVTEEKLDTISNDKDREDVDDFLKLMDDTIWINDKGKGCKAKDIIGLFTNAVNMYWYCYQMLENGKEQNSFVLKPFIRFSKEGKCYFSTLLNDDSKETLLKIRYDVDEVMNDGSLSQKQQQFIKMIFPTAYNDILTVLMFAIQNLWKYFECYGEMEDD